MNLPRIAPHVGHQPLYSDSASVSDSASPSVILSGKGGGGGGGGPQPPASGVCARSCYDCSNAGYSSCSYNQWCANRYPSGPYSSGLPYGCG
jgi:hypothetical protein